VGKTSDIAKRLQEHRDGTGAAWTRKYKPMSIAKTMPLASPFDEDKVTKEYMSMYGIDNVRGGAYVSEVLDAAQRTALQREIWGAKGCCTRCGRKSHFVATCNARTTIEGTAIEEVEVEEELWGCETCDRTFDTEAAAEHHERFCGVRANTVATHSSSGCHRCGRQGHYASNCYASTTVSATRSSGCHRCGRQGHYASNCYASTTVSATRSSGCHRCGREGHYASNCYASTTVSATRSSGCHRCGREGHYASNCYASTTVRGEWFDDDDSD